MAKAFLFEASTLTLISKSITVNGTYNASSDGADGYSSVTVNVPATPAAPVLENDVTFYDYDGTIVASYTAADFANLSAMPANPTHTGLTAQGWNWTLADAKTYVASYRKLNIGQMYATTSGKTEYDIILDESTGLTVETLFGGNSTDWGDGITNSSASHTYSNYGAYTIKFTATTAPKLTANEMQIVQHIRLAQGVLWGNERIGSPRLKTITISDVSSTISQRAGNCFALQAVIVPKNCNITTYAFRECNSLKIICLPPSFTALTSTFLQNNFALQSITIPNGVTTIGSLSLQNCKSLQSITIPSSVTSIASQSMQYMDNAKTVWVYATTPPTLSDITGMPPNVTKIYIPNGTLSAYQTASNWSNFSSKFVELPA